MKKIIFALLTICAPFAIKAQVQTIAIDHRDSMVVNNLDQQAVFVITLIGIDLTVEIDYDGSEGAFVKKTFNYKLSDVASKIWSETSSQYVTVFDLEPLAMQPIGGLISLATNSVMFFYSDNSTLIYKGIGLKLII